MFADMTKIIPEGTSGTVSVKHNTVNSHQNPEIQTLVTWRRSGQMPFGTYAQLFVKDQLCASDTPLERKEYRQIIQAAQGKVLIAGLGLGTVLVPILSKDDVTSVTVLEKNKDIISLVVAHLRSYLTEDQSSKLEVIHQDLFEYDPPHNFDVVFFDIWTDIDKDAHGQAESIFREKFSRMPQVQEFYWCGDYARSVYYKAMFLG